MAGEADGDTARAPTRVQQMCNDSSASLGSRMRVRQILREQLEV